MKKKINSVLVAVFALIVASAASGEDAYIESDGTQFLVDDYHLKPDTKFELDFQLTEIVPQCRLLGVAGAGAAATNTALPRCELYMGADGAGVHRFSLNASKANGTRQAANMYAADLLRHTIIIDYPASSQQFQVWTDGTLSYSRTFSAFHTEPSPYPLGIFARNDAKSGAYKATYKTPMRLYGFKIYESGSLVRNYVPCIKGGMVGLKDEVSGRFLSGENVTPFTCGGDILVEKDEPYISTGINTNVLYVSQNVSTGKCICLDTGYVVKPTTRVELDYASLEPNWTSSKTYKNSPWFIGAYGKNANDAALNFYYASVGGSGNGYCCYRIGTDSERPVAALSLEASHNVRRTVSMDSNSIRVVTTGYTNLSATVAAGKEVTEDLDAHTLTIGARYDKAARYIPMKIYGLKIYESDELVKDYRPFISNSVPGLVNSLDENDRLYSFTPGGTRLDGNIHATNIVFSAGGSISDDAEEKEAYLEFDGVNGHKIDTNYSISKDSCLEIDFAPWSTTYNRNFDMFGHGDNESTTTIVWARLYCNTAYQYSYYFKDSVSTSPDGVNFGVNVSNERIQVKLDGYNSKAIVTSGGKTLKNLDITTTHTAPAGQRSAQGRCNLYIGASYAGGTRSSCIRLYSFKISEAGVLKRHYVPCTHEGQAGLYDLCEGEFYPLTGGKVYGKVYKGQSERGTFEVSPKPAKITKGAGGDTLTCLAPGASSFEWYKDGVLIEGETTDSLTVAWSRKEADVATYSVKPVYTVFNEKVLGDAATAQVEMTPVGMMISVQ